MNEKRIRALTKDEAALRGPSASLNPRATHHRAMRYACFAEASRCLRGYCLINKKKRARKTPQAITSPIVHQAGIAAGKSKKSSGKFRLDHANVGFDLESDGLFVAIDPFDE